MSAETLSYLAERIANAERQLQAAIDGRWQAEKIEAKCRQELRDARSGLEDYTDSLIATARESLDHGSKAAA